jgi:release factor glutamine methyltransferase
MANLKSFLDDAVDKLTQVSGSPRLDTELLLCHALDINHAGLILRLDETIEIPESFSTMIERRLLSEPIAYILGEWEFFSMPLAIRPPTLVPRPETEHLVESVLRVLPTPDAHILEIGTGSGCIPMAIAKHAPECTIIATDIKPDNLALALENATRHGLENRITFREGSLFKPIENTDEKFHIICSNPPYIPSTDESTLSRNIRDYEDSTALYSGEDGLDLIREIITKAQAYLEPGGYLIIEIGIHQHPKLSVLLEEHGYDTISFQNDLAGIKRIAIGRKPS